jgi:molybdopterin biosynthesis enzyme
MAAEIKSDQRITRLTPLADVLAHIEAHVKPVAHEQCDSTAARGLTLAEDVRAVHALPAKSIALRDGYAVDSETTRDASSYALVTVAAPAFVNAGESLPPGTDSILPEETVIARGKSSEIQSAATIGDGVLTSGADADPGSILLRSGYALRGADIALLRAAGISSVSVRAPRIAMLCAKRGDRFLDACHAWMTHAVATAGGHIVEDNGDNLEAAVGNSKCDAAIMIGGTGSGRNDTAVTTLARIGELAFHGIAIAPGETAAFGYAFGKPVFLVPGRLDATLAGWLLLGETMLNCLSARRAQFSGYSARLTRKVASSLGITELVPVSCKGEQAEPLASGYLPLQAIARADGWISVPAQSEGYPAGTNVIVRPLP